MSSRCDRGHFITPGEPCRQCEMERAGVEPEHRTPEKGLHFKAQADGSAELVYVGDHPRTLDELIEACEADTEVWQVERWDAKSWQTPMKIKTGEGTEQAVQVPNYYVWAKFGRKEVDTREIVDQLKRDMAGHEPSYAGYPTVRIKDDADRHQLVVSIPDLHIDKYAWAAETGEDWDSDIAVSRYLWAVDKLVQRASGFAIDEVVLPVGNDLFNTDDLLNRTTSGTPQDVDTRYQHAFRRARRMLVAAIDELMNVAPVYVPVIPGNHDREKMFYLGDALEAWYRDTERATVDNRPKLRKYRRYGITLLGWTHGKDEKMRDLPNIMANEADKRWSQATFREFHIGHWHKKKETKFHPVDEFNGVRVRVIPSLTGTDAWHYRKGYTEGMKSAEAYLYNHETGYCGHFSANVLPDAEAA